MKELIRIIVRHLLALAISDRASIPILAGVAHGYKIPRDVAMANLSILFGRYEQAVTDTILSIERPVRVAYDVGAHVGLTTLILAKRFGTPASIVAFEPLSENVARLEALVAANRMLNVLVIPVVLSDKCGNAKFLRRRASSMGMLDSVAAEDSIPSLKEHVHDIETRTLDSFVLDEGHPPPDLIKIDVEGAETLVVRGGKNVIARFRPVLLIELHGPKHAGEVWDLLQDQEYEWTYIDSKHGPKGNISERSQLLAYFGPGDRWTQHVLLR